MNKLDLLLTNNCHFHLGEEPDAWQAWYDDKGWSEVSLPHDWSVTQPFSKQYSSGTGYLAGGIGWYRISFSAKEEWKEKQISILFDGVYNHARVWCNSAYLGERPNGYIPFSFDLTDLISYEHENVICVRVDHREISDSRWFTGSGIYRNVHLVIEEKVSVLRDGVFFSTSKDEKGTITATVSNEVINHLNSEVTATIKNEVIELDTGKTIAQGESTLTIGGKSEDKITNQFIVDNPLLWSPDEPNLYSLRTTIAYQRPESISHICDERKVGFRFPIFDANTGFTLNDVPTLFKGVCIHHDAGVLGAAVYKPVWRRRLQKLKDMGCNAIRFSHNPHLIELVDLCDEMGFLVMDEAFDEWEGPKNKWWQGHNVYPPRNQGYYVHFREWHKADLTDLIRRDRNHASVVMWSIGNEIDYPNDPYNHPSFASMTGNNDANKPLAERQYNPLRPNAERLAPIAAHLVDIVKESDATRPVTLAAAFPELSAKIGFLDALDVIGFNYKEHLYDENHAAFPDKPILGSENGHNLAQWKAVTDCPYISGQFLWTGIDYLGEAHGWPIHGSGAGIITMAGFEKTSYYRRQSFWLDETMVHLSAMPLPESASEEEVQKLIENEYAPVAEIWNYKKGSKVLVKCYTNASEIELFLNKESLGIFQKDSNKDCIATILTYEPGQLQAKVVGSDIEHSIFTTGCAVDAHITATSEDIDGTNNKLIQVEISMLDTEGHRVYSDSTKLFVSVEEGKLLGLENGDNSDVTEYTASYRRAYKGQLIAYILADRSVTPTLTIKGENNIQTIASL